MWNTQQTSEKSLSKWWQSRTKVMMNNYRWNVFRVEREAQLRHLKVGSLLRTLCSQCSVSVIVKAKTEHVSSVKLISSLTLQTLVTENNLGSPGSAAIKCTLIDSLQGGEECCAGCSTAALETASKQRAFTPINPSCVRLYEFSSVTTALTVLHGCSNPSLWFWFPLQSHFKRARPALTNLFVFSNSRYVFA